MKVAILKDEALSYCTKAAFHPPRKYPEYPFDDVCPDNAVYDQVRTLLRMLGMDAGNYDTESWNPLGEIIKPGDRVLIKPNFVSHHNPVGGIEPLVTNGSVIRPVVDYVRIALKGQGTITIGDAPMQTSDFGKVVRSMGVDRIVDYYRANGGPAIDIVDFRKEIGRKRIIGDVVRSGNAGDPRGYTAVDLGNDSEFADIVGDSVKFRIADYNKNEVSKHHNSNKNEYYIPNSVLNADVVINMPKLKTHGKAGITCSLKNLIGINGLKDWLPHHRSGSAEEGGDEYIYKDTRKKMLVTLREDMNSTRNTLFITSARMLNICLIASNKVVPFKDQCIQGSWFGNDTIPRTIADLNKILLYADKKGTMRDTVQRKVFVLVDGIVGGEKEGPLTPSPKRCGVLVAGHNPVETDLVCSRIMGFDHEKILTFKYAMSQKKYRLCSQGLGDIQVIADDCEGIDDLYRAYNCHFAPPKGWKGHIEYDHSKGARSLT